MRRARWILFVAVLTGGLAVGRTLLPVAPPAGPIDYDDYETADLIELADSLARWHRHAEAIEAGEEALTRYLEPHQDAAIRHKMAQSYEFVPNGGRSAKKMYEELLHRHPMYERIIELAYRLGELNSSSIMEGTQPDLDRAMECFEYAIRRSEALKTDPQDVHYIALKAHMSLGILRWRRGDHAAARRHFEAIYRCPTHRGKLLPFEQLKGPGDRNLHDAWLRKRISSMKKRIPTKLVGLCIRRDMGKSLVELGHLAGDYARDPNVMEPLREAIRELAELDTLVDQAIENLAQRPALEK